MSGDGCEAFDRVDVRLRTERQVALEVRSTVLAKHAEAVNLLFDLVVTANNELSRVTGIPFANPPGPTEYDAVFRLTTLAQSVSAGFVALNLVLDGYPRFGFATGRFLREGHIAIAWAAVEPQGAAAAGERILWGPDRGEAPPTAGTMARRVEGMLHSGPREDLRDWGAVLRAWGRIQDLYYTHAISVSSLRHHAVTQFGQLLFRPGPLYDPEATEDALNSLIPLARFLLSDAATTVSGVIGASTSPDAAPLIQRAGEWWQAHPPTFAAEPVWRDRAGESP